MELVRFKKGEVSRIPDILENNVIYVGISNDDDEGSYSKICIDGKEWVSKEYIDMKIGDIEKLLNEL